MRQKHYIITGVSRGFGKALGYELAGEESVLHLVTRSDISEWKEELEDLGTKVCTYVYDLVETAHLRTLLEKIGRNMDPGQMKDQENADMVITLINNAGMLEPVGPAGKYDAKTYWNNLEVNFVAPVMLTHHFLEIFQHVKVSKRVVMISSGAADQPFFGWSHYCSTKAGIDMFVKVVGIEQEQQPYPVEIMAFNPGRIGTDMQKLIRETDEKDFPMVHDFINAWKKGLIGDPRAIAGRLAKQICSEYFPSGKVLSHRDI